MPRSSGLCSRAWHDAYPADGDFGERDPVSSGVLQHFATGRRVGGVRVDRSETSDECEDARFAVLYRAQFLVLMRVAFLMTGSNETAEDVVQDTFIRCRSRLGDLEHPPSSLRAAVINECRSVHRRSRRRRINSQALKTSPLT